MKKYGKKLVSICLVLVFLAQALSIPALAGTTADPIHPASLPKIVISDDGTYTVQKPGFDRDPLGYTAAELGIYEPDDQVNAIVMLPGDSILSLACAAGMTVADYLKTDIGRAARAAIYADQERVLTALGADVSDVKYRYSTIFSGFACRTAYKNLDGIEARIVGSSAMVAERYQAEMVATDNALNAYSTGIYNSSNAGYTGKGMVVAVLDTGLDYNHTAFQRLPDGDVRMTADDIEEIFPNLMASGLNASSRFEECYYSDKVVYMYDYADKDSDVYPVNDHGTHVAGIIAGKDDVITGVAIDAQLAIMKVFGNEDAGAEQEDLLAALEDAVILGVDVINMSLGASCGFTQSDDDELEIARVYDSVREAGINLIVAASNSYSSAKGSNVGDTNRTSNPDSSTLGSPATYNCSMAVASVLGAKSNYLLVNGKEPVYLTKAKNSYGDDIEFYEQMLAGRETAELEYVLVPGIGNDGNYENVDVTGKIAVIKRGVTTFEEKVQTAAAHGAIGAIIYNNVSGIITMTIGVATLPTCSITMDAGTYFVENPTGTVNLSAGNLAGPFMSEFSSWGPNPDLILTPDVTSYGGDINSAVRGGYDIYSGTSMACPNLAGSAALVRQYVRETYPELSLDEVTTLVQRLLMSTASILCNESGNPYSPRKQGSGLADAERAIHAGAYLLVEGSDKSKLSLGDDPQKTGHYELVFTLKNVTDHTLSYDFSEYVMTETVSSDEKTVAELAHLLAPGVTYSVENGGLNGRTVTVAGYSEAVITVKIDLTDADRTYLDTNFANGMYVEGFVTLTSRDGDCNLTIPYLAFYGDWTQAPLLDVTAFEEGKEQKNPAILEDEKLKADVYATIPMSGFLSGSEEIYYYMGKIPYSMATGYEAIPVLEEYCALTTSKEGMYQLRGISSGLLRNAKTVHMTITDPLTGEVIFERTKKDCRKSCYNGGQTGGFVEAEFDVSEAGLANNTKYLFEMTCDLDWEGEQNNLKNTFSFTFYVDNESPIVDYDQTVMRVEKDKEGNVDRYLLDLYVYDNRFPAGFFITTYDEIDENGNAIEPKEIYDGFIPVDDMVAATSNKITLDLTSVWHKLKNGDAPDSKNIRFEILDYAMNRSIVNMTLEKVDAKTVNFKNGRKTTEKGDEISFTLAPNKQLNLRGTSYLITTPTDVYTNDLVWTSSDTTIANVQNGVVTALANGTCTITATSATGASASVTINCTGKPASTDIPVSGLTLNASALSLVRGEKYELYATVQPWNAATSPELSWSSSSPYVTLTVDPANPAHCTAFAAKSGSATVSVKATGTLFSAACRIGVADEYTLSGSVLQKYRGKGDENGVVEIPDDKGIMYISRLAFYNNKDITKVIIPEGVEEIQYAAFYGCENLKEIVLPSTCKKLDEWAFGYDEKLEKINLEHVETICQLAFYGDKALGDVDLSSCYTICDRAFSFCRSMKHLDISHVGQIGEYCFVYCTGLEELVTSPINKITDYAFVGCTGLRTLDLYATYVGEYAFYYCSSLTDVTFCSDISEVDQCAFYGVAALTNVSFRGTCKYINHYAFANCLALTSIFVPAGCEYLGDYAFGAAYNVKSITFSADARLRSIGLNPFYLDYQVEGFTVEEGSKYLAVKDGLLYDKNMTRLILAPFAISMPALFLPTTVKEIGDYALSTSYNIGLLDLRNVERVGTGAFAMSGIRTFNPGTALREIGDRAFVECRSLEPFTLPATLESIGDYAFAGLDTAWGTLVLPSGLTHVGKYAFSGNSGLTAVTIPASLPEVPTAMFGGCAALSSVTIESGVTKIGDYAFLQDTALETIALPDTVTELGDGAFAECTGLKTVTLSSALTAIPAHAFFHDTVLTAPTLPATVKEIGDFAFNGATAITNFDFAQTETVGAYAFIGTGLTALSSEKIRTVGDGAFDGTALVTVDLPACEEVGASAFAHIPALTTVSLPLARKVGASAFYGASALTALDLPACEEIGAQAFSHASNLAAVTFPAVKSIGSYAFYNTRVTSLALPASLETVEPNAFTTKAYSSEDETRVRLDTLTLDAQNPNFFLDDGVLYRYLTDSTYLLVAYPSGKTDTAYTVKDGTVRIGDYAFSTNVALEDVTVARTVKYLGTGAFYGCTGLSSVSFLSVVAPTLESTYSSAARDGWTYNNLVYDIGETVDLDIIVPKNAVGYDSILWARYVGAPQPTDVISMTDSTAFLIQYINDLPATLTLADAETVDYLEKVLNATDAEQKKFVTNIEKLRNAITTIAALRAAQPQDPADPTNPTDPSGENEQGGGCGSSIAVGSSLAMLALVSMAFTFVLLNKKKGGKTDEE